MTNNNKGFVFWALINVINNTFVNLLFYGIMVSVKKVQQKKFTLSDCQR